MRYIKKYIKYIIGFTILILILFFGFYYKNEQKYTGTFIEDTTPVPIADWTPFISNYGFSFMYPANLKVETDDILIKVGGIIVKIEKLNCNNPTFSKKITSKTKLYGFRAQIDESQKIAYICNNINTACLNIQTNIINENKTKITEGFFHSFLSTLNISKDFDKISCTQ